MLCPVNVLFKEASKHKETGGDGLFLARDKGWNALPYLEKQGCPVRTEEDFVSPTQQIQRFEWMGGAGS